MNLPTVTICILYMALFVKIIDTTNDRSYKPTRNPKSFQSQLKLTLHYHTFAIEVYVKIHKSLLVKSTLGFRLRLKFCNHDCKMY